MLLTSVLCKHACASVPCRHAVLYSVQCVVCHVLLWKRSESYLIYLTVCGSLALCFHPAGSPRAVPGRANAKAHRWSRHPSHMPRTRYLTTAQLQAVLRGRGVVLPEGGAQPHAFYLDLCHSQGLEEVTSAELEEAMQKSPRRGGAAATPGRWRRLGTGGASPDGRRGAAGSSHPTPRRLAAAAAQRGGAHRAAG